MWDGQVSRERTGHLFCPVTCSRIEDGPVHPQKAPEGKYLWESSAGAACQIFMGHSFPWERNQTLVQDGSSDVESGNLHLEEPPARFFFTLNLTAADSVNMTWASG